MVKRVVTLDWAIVFDEYFSVKFVSKYLPKFTLRQWITVIKQAPVVQKVDNATG